MTTDTGGFSDNGVSEVIGVVLLISIVVLAVAIVGVGLTSRPAPEKIPAASVLISAHNGTVRIYHSGGDTLQKSMMEVLVDGHVVPVVKAGGNAGWTEWSAGETLVYTLPSGMPGIVRIVYRGSSGSVVLASADFRT